MFTAVLLAWLKTYMWHVYIIKCSDNSLYTGITTDISRRLKEHNNKKGGSYTRVRQPVKLVYKEDCLTRSRALKREYRIKCHTRDEKLALIKNTII
jgi:putative endonuclease